jgi:hypothetical protein
VYVAIVSLRERITGKPSHPPGADGQNGQAVALEAQPAKA